MIEYTVYWEHFDPITSTSIIREIEVDEGAISVNRFDEALDTALIVIPYTKRKDEYNRLDNITIEMTQGGTTKSYYYCIAQDSVETISKRPLLYKHTLSLVERTKKLERFLASTLTFTQPTDGTIRYTLLDVIERIRDTTPFEVTENVFSTRVFNVPNSLDFLDTIEAPQLFLTQMTIREALNSVGQVINAIPRLEDNDNLSFDYFNYLETLLTNVNGISFTSTNDIDYYATSIESYTRNAVMEDNEEQAQVTYPSKVEYLHLKGDVLLDTNTAYFDTEMPIYNLISARIPMFISYYKFIEGTGAVPRTTIVEVDITDFVLPKKLWDLLTDELSSYNMGTGEIFKTKRNTLYFTIGDTKIQPPFKSYGDPIFDWQTAVYSILVEQIEKQYEFNIINNAFEVIDIYGNTLDILIDEGIELISPISVDLENPPLYTAGTGEDNAYWANALIKVEYKPQLDTRLRLEREDISSINKDTHILSNQEDRIISLDYYIKNLRGQIQRIGNDNITLVFLTNNLNDIVNMGDYFLIDEGKPDYYVCVISEITSYNDHVINRCEFTKNFNRISEYVGLNNEIRQYEIPSDDKTYERNVHYAEYVELGDYEIFEGTPNFFMPLGRNTFMNVLDYDEDYDKPITSARFEPLLPQGYDERYLYIPISANGDENTLIFTMKYNSNQLAGYAVNSVDSLLLNSLNKLIPVRYTLDDGSLEQFRFEFANELPLTYPSGLPTSSLVGLRNIIYNSLSVPNATGITSNERLLRSPYMYLYKDPSEIFKMTYQLQILPSRDNYGKIIVGRFLARNNNLVNVYSSDNVIKNGLKVYGHADAFGKFENQKIKTGSVDLSANVSIGIEYAVGNRQPKLVLTDATNVLATYKSWAIADSLGRLYLAVNQDATTEGYIPKKTIYFNFLNKRRGIILGNDY